MASVTFLSKNPLVSMCLRRLLLPSIMVAGIATPAGASVITSYQMTGIFDYSYITDSNWDPVNNVYVDVEPVSGPTPFTLSFDLDGSVPRTSGTSTSSAFQSAVSNITLNVDGVGWWSEGTSDVYEYINSYGGSVQNHQWSIFADEFDAIVNPDIGSLDLMDGDTGDYLESLSLYSLNLFLLDTDAALFASTPPGLVVFDGSEFEFFDIELTWGSGSYNYTLAGNITDISVSAVPLPGAVWLFGSALLGLAGFAGFRRT